MKKLFFILALVALLLAGCGGAGNAPAVQTAEPAVQAEEITEPAAQIEPELSEVSELAEMPEEPEPVEPWILPAEYFFSGHMQYAFGIELVNDTASQMTMTSLTVTDYRDGEQCAFREVTPEEIKAAMQGRTPELDVPAHSHTVQFVVEEPENVDFDRRVMTAVLTSADGEELAQTIRYTMNPEEAAYNGAPDDSAWNASLYFENYNSINFPCILSNDTDQPLKLKTAYTVMYVGGVPLRHRDVLSRNTVYIQGISHLEPGNRPVYMEGIGGTNAFWNHIKWVFVYESDDGETVTMEYRFVTPEGDPRDSNADALLPMWEITAETGEQQYSTAEIRQMIDEELTLDEVAEKISTIADLTRYLYIRRFTEDTRGDLEFSFRDNIWHVNRSAQTVFQENKGNCGGDSNLANYILRGDYDEAGFIQESGNRGGHIYNYFRRGDTYFVVDFTAIVGAGGKYDQYGYQISKVTDLQEFSDGYIANNHRMYPESADHHLRLQYAYAWDGSHRPVSGMPLVGVPAEMEGELRILYQEEGFEPVYMEAPTWEDWPEEAK